AEANQHDDSLPLVHCESLRPAQLGDPDSVVKIGVFTLNVQHASAARSRRQAQWLSSREDADVIVLTEVAGGTHAHTLIAKLRLPGYDVIIPTDVSRQYRVLVASRVGTIEPGVFTVPMRQRLISVRVAAGEVTFDVIGVYVPSRGPAHQ